MDYLADTSFLIDLWREARNPGHATRSAQANAGKQVGTCWIVEAEFLCGSALAEHDPHVVAKFLGAYPVIHSTSSMTRRYASLFADLKRRNQLIGPNDLWIAACALELARPLITRNTDEFGRIDGLALVDYR